MPVLEQLQTLSEDRFLALYESLSEQGFGPLDGEVANVMKFRPQAIRKLPMAQRAKRARALIEGQKNVNLCYELVGTYLVRNQKDLVTTFLDETGVQHEDGMIEDVDQAAPDPAKLSAAIETLDGKFDREDVNLYLALCAEQWPESEELQQAWSSRG